ncbi:MAG: hypothetical protein QOI31_3109 [Solirubrobacterales bacterium]|jgi:hypothetical protein|nr:hypothetical protein [Solirubrobacterales bacterium]
MGSELIESIARAQHSNYVREQTARGETSDGNLSLVAWDELPEPLRQSSRRYAEGVKSKLDAIGAKAVVGDGQPFKFTEEELEMLARFEHDRWAGDLARDGWVPGPVKDPERKEHPLLVGWDELSEAEREKDRDAVRNIPAVLRDAGYGIARG